MKKTNHFKTLLVLAMAAVLFITSLSVWPSVPLSASATEKEDLTVPTKMASFVADGLYDTVYYFSDDGSSQQYVYNLVGTTQITKIVPEIYPFNNFETQIILRFSTGVEDIKDGYVIFEMRNYVSGWYDAIRDYPYTGFTDTIQFLSILESSFAEMSLENNCKIMLIFGTDEELLVGNTGFLKFVDVQVNTDVLYPIFYSIYTDFYEDIYNNLFTHTVLLSPIFSNIDGNVNWYFAFVQMLVFCYRGLFINETQGKKDEEVWNFMNQNHNFWLWEEYRDLDQAEFVDMIDLGEVVGIGTTIGDEYDLWEEYMRAIRENYASSFPLYVLNSANISVAPWITAGGYNIFYSGSGDSTLALYIPLIMTDFVLEDYASLLQYDNWPGICPITFKPILPGPGGWVKRPAPITDLVGDI